MKIKNLQSGFAPLLIIAIVAVLAVGGGVYISKQKEVRKAELGSNMEADVDADADVNVDVSANVNTKGSLRSLLGLSKNAMCTFSSTAGGTSSSGTVYISASGDMRGEFKSQTSGSGSVESNMIVKGGTSYVWSGSQGMKMDVSATTSASADASAKQAVDMDSQVDYKCEDWTLDSSKFSVPTSVNFLDLGAMLKTGGSLPGGVKLPY